MKRREYHICIVTIIKSLNIYTLLINVQKLVLLGENEEEEHINSVHNYVTELFSFLLFITTSVHEEKEEEE